jgi:putative transposase
MGIDSGISKSEVSRICERARRGGRRVPHPTLDHIEFPYVYLDATYLHVRNQAGQVVSMAVVVATGVTADGSGRSSAWTSATARTRSSGGLPASLKQRGLPG